MPKPQHRKQRKGSPQGGWGSIPAAVHLQLDGELVKSTSATPSQHPRPNQCSQLKSTAVAQSTPSSGLPCIAPQPFDVYVVLDFEATCKEGKRIADAEVIEFPMVLVDPRTAEPVAEFQRYVRPVKNPVLSPFCTQLTGITQGMVRDRDPFPVVYCEALQFLAEAGLGDAPPMRSYCIVTCGDWDLKTMLPMQMRISGKQGTPLSFQRWCNLKKYMLQVGFGHRNGHGCTPLPCGPFDMPEMVKTLGLPLRGRHHSGIDDCRNLAAVVCALLKRGLVMDVTACTTSFVHWHAPAEARLPALDSLPSTLADGAVQRSRSVCTPPRSRPRAGDTSQPKQQQQQSPAQAKTSHSACQPTSSVHILSPALVIDTSRDAVQELLSDTNLTATPSRVFDEAELKKVSKFMSTLLRHKAIQWKVPITSNGYVLLDDVLRQPQLKKQQLSVQDVARIVRDSDKQRFRLAYGAADGRLYIAAVQGHSIDGVEPQLRKLTSVEEVPVAVHGTYWKAWKAIQQCSYLSTMNRQHIHFAKGLMSDAQVVSGMRENVQVLLYLDVAAVLADGVPLYESTNGVILTPGVGDTRQLPLTYVAKVVDQSTGGTIYPASCLARDT
ncbi:phosphotransferase, putative [Leishmania tarentolae]|uniref:2'-phosphotransferase n=1 Tax=Leishmania tarentolae TaxID=5689 RepID=A0A640KNA4_LEITA|nr:phosphotransferase, putative [Leishmania tarentolae]